MFFKLSSKESEVKFDICKDLPKEQYDQLHELLMEYKDVFAFSVFDIKKANFVQASFRFKDPNKIIRSRPYRFSPQDLAEAHEYVKELLKYGIVEPSYSPHQNSLFFIKKPNSNAKRCLLDMRRLNENMVPYDFPITLQDQYLDSFVGSSIFSVMDFRNGYWSIELDEQSRDATSFAVPEMGKFRFCRIPQGCSVSAQYFAHILNYLLADIRKLPDEITKGRPVGLAQYFDDVSIYSSDFSLHLIMLKRFLQRLRDANMSLNPNKSKFGYSKVKVLGYEVQAGQINIDPSRKRAVADIRVPKSLKEARKVFGFFSFLRRFIKNFSTIAAPIAACLRTTVDFTWTEAATESLNILKEKLLSAPPLKIYNNKDKTIMKTDASSTGVAAEIWQYCDKSKKYLPVAFASRLLKPAEKSLRSSTAYEIIAVVFGTTEFRHYLAGIKWTLYCDNKAVTLILNRKAAIDASTCPHKIALYILHLQSFTFDAVWQRSENLVDCDFLSRYPSDKEPENDERLTIEDWIINAVTREQLKGLKPDEYGYDDEDETSSCFSAPDITEDWLDEDNIPLAEVAQRMRHPNSAAAKKWNDKLRRLNLKLPSSPHLSCFMNKNNSSFLDEQLKDDRLKQIYEAKLSNKPPDKQTRQYVIDNGLIKFKRKGRFLICIPKHLQENLVAIFHDQISLHSGIAKTLETILQKYHFPGVSVLVENYVKSCKQCALYKNPNAKPGLIRAVRSNECMDILFADVLGPVQLFDEKQRPHNIYVHVIVDSFSKYLFTRLIKNTRTKTIISCFNEAFRQMGLCQLLYTDRASYYTSEDFQAYLAEKNILHYIPPPNCPFVMGQAESAVKQCKARLKHIFGNKPSLWSEELDAATFCLNCMYRESIKTSSFEAMHGFLPRVAVDNSLGSSFSKDSSDKNEDRLLIREQIKGNLEKYRNSYEYYANKDRQEVSYLPGDLVYVFERHGSSSDARFLRHHWKGPYEIIAKESDTTYWVKKRKWRKEVIDLVHVRYLKPAHKRVEVDAEK